MSYTEKDGTVNDSFVVETSDGEMVRVVKKYDGTTPILVAEDGTEYIDDASTPGSGVIKRDNVPEAGPAAKKPDEVKSEQIGGREDVEEGRADTGDSVDGDTFVKERPAPKKRSK